MRRSLSQDGRTLVLTPEANLDLASTYHLVADGYSGVGGDIAPRAEFLYSTPAVQAAPDVDFSRIKLGYPDANLNVAITIPAGALPSGAKIEIEAPGMGSVYTGTMLPTDLGLTMKASLGERLTIKAALTDGRTFQGYLSRYESNDGTGRVTVGVDGGRVEASDGSGAAVNLPLNALEKPIEFVCQYTEDPSTDLLPEVADATPIFGRVQLLSKEAANFKRMPRIEMKAPEDAVDLGVFNGFGTYGVFYRNSSFGPDGQPATYYEWLDTAQVADGKLKGMGGLPWNLLAQTVPDLPSTEDASASLSSLGQDSIPTGPDGLVLRSKQAYVVSAKAALPAVDWASRASILLAAKSPTDILCPVGLSDFPLPSGNYNAALMDLYQMVSPWIPAPRVSSSNEFTVELDGMIVKNPGKIILKGRARTEIPGQPRYETVGAPLYYAPDGQDVNLQGRLMSRTNECGSYMLMNAMWFDEPLQDGGALLCLEPNFGIAKSWTKASWNLWSNDTKNDRKLYQIPGFVFKVQPSQMGDQTAPWADCQFSGANVMTQDRVKAGENWIIVYARDNKDGVNLGVEVRLDNVRARVCDSTDPGGVNSSNYYFKQDSSGIGMWAIRVNLVEGTHRVEVLVKDQSGNSTRLERTVFAIDFGQSANAAPDPNKAPSFTLDVAGGLESAQPDAMIKVRFSEPVKNVDQNSLHLEKLVDGAWVPQGNMEMVNGTIPTGEICLTWIVPPSPLQMGNKYRVVGDSTIVDMDDPAKPLRQDPIEFRVQSHTLLGSVNVPGANRVVSLGRAVFVGDKAGQIHLVHILSQGLVDKAIFGVSQAQDVTALEAFDNVTVPGHPYPTLVLVTTQF